MEKSIDERIAELIKKADNAQRSGNYPAMNEYDRKIQALQNQRFELLLSMYNGNQKTIETKQKRI